MTELGSGSRTTLTRQAGQAREITGESPLSRDCVECGADVLGDLYSVRRENLCGVIEGASTETGQRDGDPLSPRQTTPSRCRPVGFARRIVRTSCHDVCEHPLAFCCRIDATRQTVDRYKDIDHNLLCRRSVTCESLGHGERTLPALCV